MSEWTLLVAALGVALPALISAIVSAYVAVQVRHNAVTMAERHSTVNSRMTELLLLNSQLYEAIGYRKGVDDERKKQYDNGVTI